MSRIDRLTPDQESRLPAIRDEWIQIGLSTESADRGAAERHVDDVYHVSGFDPPSIKIWRGAPPAGALGASMLALIGKQVGYQIKTQIEEHVRHRVWGQISAQVENRIRDQATAQVEEQVRHRVLGQVEQIGGRLSDQVWFQIETQVEDQVRRQVGTQIWRQIQDQISRKGETRVKEQIESHVRFRIRNQVSAQVMERIHRQIGGQVWGQVWNEAEYQVRHSVWRQLSDQIWNQTEDWIEDQKDKQVREKDQVWVQAQKQVRRAGYGSQDAGWLSFYAVSREFGVEAAQRLDPLMGLARTCGWWWPFEGAAILTERPCLLHHDEQGRLHDEAGPAILYPDGWGLAFWHGVRVPRKVIEAPETLTVQDIEDEENIEARRVIIERYGEGRYLEDSGAVAILEDEYGTILRKEMSGDEPMVMVRVVNSTPDADGSRKIYHLRVPPDMTTPRAGIAWSFGMDGDAYRPELET